MNYEKRFNKIVEQIGDRDEIDGINSIYRTNSKFISIKAEGIDIARSCDGKSLYSIDIKIHNIYDSSDWSFITNLSKKVEEWFDYVENKVKVKEEMIEIDGKKFSKSTIKEALKNYLK